MDKVYKALREKGIKITMPPTAVEEHYIIPKLEELEMSICQGKDMIARPEIMPPKEEWRMDGGSRKRSSPQLEAHEQLLFELCLQMWGRDVADRWRDSLK